MSFGKTFSLHKAEVDKAVQYALIMEYYPALSAVQIKEIIMKTVIKRTMLKDKCISGGVVNAYNSLKLAADYK